MHVRTTLALAEALVLATAVPASAQTTPLLPADQMRAIREESSGERALAHFRYIVGHYSGFTPSRGGDQIAEYLAEQARDHGLSSVAVEGFPADGKRFFWTFLTEPAWEAEAGTLTMVQPRSQLLADFSAMPVVLGRFSTTADTTAALVDVGAGTSEADYTGKDVRGKLALASGDAGTAHAWAVWRHGAAGIVTYRMRDAREPLPLVANPSLVPWSGLHGESPGVAFGIPYAVAAELRDLLARHEPVVLHARVKATTGAGAYQQVSAVIPGTDPTLPEIWVNAHDNYRNTGGANNLTGVGATVEIGRVLATLIARGTLSRPRRSIRFLWGAEHHSSVYNFFVHPDRTARVLAFLNVDMVGYHQERAKSVFHLYRTPASLPHFVNDVAEEFLGAVGRANAETVREAAISSPLPNDEHDPLFAPTGSRDQLHYSVEEFWGPSDHEDVVTLGVPAVLYNDWPDPWIGTQEDDLGRTDPTQMRRAILTIAATTYYLATATPSDAVRLVHLVATGAETRMAADLRRAFAVVDESGIPEAATMLEQSFARERETLRTLGRLGSEPGLAASITEAAQWLQAVHAAHLAALSGGGSRMAPTAKKPARAAAPIDSSGLLVPVRVDSIKGPVHFFRPEFGVAWLAKKTGRENVSDALRLARRGHYTMFETLNFADGRRSLAEIRNAVSAEYGLIPLDEIVEYFRFLEKAGVVSLASK
jgi:hypothetical protein